MNYTLPEVLKKHGNELFSSAEDVGLREILGQLLTKVSDCWLDSFIMGNVYILGFGFDFSELDLWWLIKQKKRENAEPHGKVIFYTPEKIQEAGKYALLSAYGVEIRHLDF